MTREYYSDSIANFLNTNTNEILGRLVTSSDFSVERNQKDAWLEEIFILKKILVSKQGQIYFEYTIPRMGKRIDVLLVIKQVIFVLEFKVGNSDFELKAFDQVCDYALDLKNFHETSHNLNIAPILIATKSIDGFTSISMTTHGDNILLPIKCNPNLLLEVINKVLIFCSGSVINIDSWSKGRYKPTPTIIEAATALYNGHTVSQITRNDAGAINLARTSDVISEIIKISRIKSQKSICFVTGVPGSGKTLVGLNIATKHIDKKSEMYSVFLSGNQPLVSILREALARDKVKKELDSGKKIKKSMVASEVKVFIQNVHNFRDECLVDLKKAPIEHVALFDEAQRAWNLQQTANFMKRRKGNSNFNQSEPEFLISCLDRHKDWAVIVCLVGGGQEINTGEAGIGEWLKSLDRSFPKWNIYISPHLTDNEYSVSQSIKASKNKGNIFFENDLHLSVSLRSFRSENQSQLIKQMLDLDIEESIKLCRDVSKNFPIVITRDLLSAKKWLKNHARGSERYGMMVSSQAERLKPYSIHVKAPVDPVHWFLEDKNDVRSSYYLEDVVTEFDTQGLELDWSCVVWDADFRYNGKSWDNWSFKGNKWQRINKFELKNYQKNAYRVLLTRARQGMVIVVPEGDVNDPTRMPEFYDNTFNYLKLIGFLVI